MRYRATFQFILLVLTATAVFAAERESRSLEQKYAAESIRRVEIELPPDTELKVRTTRDAVIAVEGEVSVSFRGATSEARRKGILQGIEIAAEMRGNRLRLFDDRSGAARTAWARRLDTDFIVTITVPEWTNIEIRQRDGKVDAKGAFGDLMIGMRGGEIDVAVPKARVKELSAKTRIGEIKADLGRSSEEREGFFPGETYYENETGQTTIRLNVTIGEISVTLEE